MEGLEETVITMKEPIRRGDAVETSRYTITYKSVSPEKLIGPFFQSVLSAICTNLYSSTILIECRPQASSTSASGSANTAPTSSSVVSQPIVHYLFIYDVNLTTLEAAKLRKKRVLSQNPEDLAINVSSFSKAFPWHFILDRNLCMVQLGTSLLKVFTPTFLADRQQQPSSTAGGEDSSSLTENKKKNNNKKYIVTQFFQFVRPDLGNEISFESIYQRLNTPFLLRLINLTKNNGTNQLAEVSLSFSHSFPLSHHSLLFLFLCFLFRN